MPKKKSPNNLRLRNSTAEFLTFAYQTGGVGVDVRVQDGTIWLSQKNMGLLFETTPENVLMHLRNIFTGKELAEDSVAKIFLATASDGKNYQIKHYNLDAIIAVGLPRIYANADAAPTARPKVSPGQRPGYPTPNPNPALKGRPTLCLNPSRVSTSISSSAPNTANGSSPTACAIPCTPTWPRCCKISAVRLCSSIPSKTTFTSFLK